MIVFFPVLHQIKQLMHKNPPKNKPIRQEVNTSTLILGFGDGDNRSIQGNKKSRIAGRNNSLVPGS